VLHNDRFGSGVVELPPRGFKREEVNHAAHEVRRLDNMSVSARELYSVWEWLYK
jgi:hypothetical protein